MKASMLALYGAMLLLALALAPIGADADMIKFCWDVKESSGKIDFYLFHDSESSLPLTNHLSAFTYGVVDLLSIQSVRDAMDVANNFETSGLQCIGTCTGSDVSWVYKLEGIPLGVEICSSAVSGAIHHTINGDNSGVRSPGVLFDDEFTCAPPVHYVNGDLDYPYHVRFTAPAIVCAGPPPRVQLYEFEPVMSVGVRPACLEYC